MQVLILFSLLILTQQKQVTQTQLTPDTSLYTISFKASQAYEPHQTLINPILPRPLLEAIFDQVSFLELKMATGPNDYNFLNQLPVEISVNLKDSQEKMNMVDLRDKRNPNYQTSEELMEVLGAAFGFSSVFLKKNALPVGKFVYSQDPLEWLCGDNLRKLSHWVDLSFMDGQKVFQSDYNGFTWRFKQEHGKISYEFEYVVIVKDLKFELLGFEFDKSWTHHKNSLEVLEQQPVKFNKSITNKQQQYQQKIQYEFQNIQQKNIELFISEQLSFDLYPFLHKIKYFVNGQAQDFDLLDYKINKQKDTFFRIKIKVPAGSFVKLIIPYRKYIKGYQNEQLKPDVRQIILGYPIFYKFEQSSHVFQMNSKLNQNLNLVVDETTTFIIIPLSLMTFSKFLIKAFFLTFLSKMQLHKNGADHLVGWFTEKFDTICGFLKI